MTQGNRRLLRLAYLAEFIILALPFLLTMGPLALIGAIAFGVLSFAPTDGSAGLAIIGMLACLSGIAAIFKFFRLSMVYIFGSVTTFGKHQKEFRLGLAFAVLPLLLTLGISGIIATDDPSLWPSMLFLSGAVLFIPITHLWLALREAGRATMKESG